MVLVSLKPVAQVCSRCLMPVTLAADTDYYLASQEVSGGDIWYDGNTVVTTTGVAAVLNTVYSGNGTTWGVGCR